MSDFKQQVEFIKTYLPNFINEQENIIIAGGMLTSVFTRKEINDVDVFCKNQQSFDSISEKLLNNNFGIIFVSNKAVTFTNGDKKIQVMHYRYFENVKDVLSDFDFSVNMAGYDLDEKKIFMEENFLLDIAARTIKINLTTKYPIISMIRVGKYSDRGFYIPKKETIKLMLKITQLEIESWDQLEDQLGGFYGGIQISEEDKKGELKIDNVLANPDKFFRDFKNSYEVKYYKSEKDFVDKTGIKNKRIIEEVSGKLFDEDCTEEAF